MQEDWGKGMDGTNMNGGISKGNRLESIDALKGIGILFMVLGHMHFSTMFDHYVYAFHMPLFFLISGYLYRKPDSMKKTIFRKTKRLLVPYFSFGTGYWILWLILHGKKEEKLFAPFLALIFNGIDGLVYESALWFLPTLFVAYIVFSVIDRKTEQVMQKAVLVILLSITGCMTTGIIFASENMGGGVLQRCIVGAWIFLCRGSGQGAF